MRVRSPPAPFSTRRSLAIGIVAGLVVLLAGCAVEEAGPPPLAPSAGADWTAPWDQRLAAYDQEMGALDGPVADAFESVKAVLVKRPVSRRQIKRQLQRFGELLFRFSQVRARWRSLERLRQAWAGTPEAGKIAALIDRRWRELAGLDGLSRRRFETFLAAYNDKVLPYRSWLDDAVTAIRERGRIIGAAREFARIAAEFETYTARTAAVDRVIYLQAQKIGLGLRAFADSLVPDPYLGRFFEALDEPRICTGLSDRIQCY